MYLTGNIFPRLRKDYCPQFSVLARPQFWLGWLPLEGALDDRSTHTRGQPDRTCPCPEPSASHRSFTVYPRISSRPPGFSRRALLLFPIRELHLYLKSSIWPGTSESRSAEREETDTPIRRTLLSGSRNLPNSLWAISKMSLASQIDFFIVV